MVRREGQAQAAPQWSAQQAYAAAPQSEFYDEDVPF